MEQTVDGYRICWNNSGYVTITQDGKTTMELILQASDKNLISSRVFDKFGRECPDMIISRIALQAALEMLPPK